MNELIKFEIALRILDVDAYLIFLYPHLQNIFPKWSHEAIFVGMF